MHELTLSTKEDVKGAPAAMLGLGRCEGKDPTAHRLAIEPTRYGTAQDAALPAHTTLACYDDETSFAGEVRIFHKRHKRGVRFLLGMTVEIETAFDGEAPASQLIGRTPVDTGCRTRGKLGKRRLSAAGTRFFPGGNGGGPPVFPDGGCTPPARC